MLRHCDGNGGDWVADQTEEGWQFVPCFGCYACLGAGFARVITLLNQVDALMAERDQALAEIEELRMRVRRLQSELDWYTTALP